MIEICFSCFTYTVTIRYIEFKRNKLHVNSVMIACYTKCADTVMGLELLVCLSTGLRCSLARSFKSTFGFSSVLSVTVVMLQLIFGFS